MIVVHCFVSDQKKFSNCPHYEGWYFLNVDHAGQGSYLMKSETWGTHLGNPANAVIGGGGECKFPKFSPLLPALFSKLSREKHSRYFDPPQKRFFQLFLLKKFLTLETSRGILGLGTEWKICRKCGKMFWAGDNRCEPCQATLPCIQLAGRWDESMRHTSHTARVQNLTAVYWLWVLEEVTQPLCSCLFTCTMKIIIVSKFRFPKFLEQCLRT